MEYSFINTLCTSKKGTESITRTVLFQKLHFCTVCTTKECILVLFLRVHDAFNICIGNRMHYNWSTHTSVFWNGSLGFEILEVVPYPDVVVVCCGGGGLLAGVAAAIKLSGCENTKIYGVEPEGACTMYKSFIEKKPVGMDAKSIASGLAPPFAGSLPYELCQKYVENIVLVTDEEIKSAVSTLYKAGLVVEPSGTAAFAAVTNDKIPDINGKHVVVILSGGNIGKDELSNFPD